MNARLMASAASHEKQPSGLEYTRKTGSRRLLWKQAVRHDTMTNVGYSRFLSRRETPCDSRSMAIVRSAGKIISTGAADSPGTLSAGGCGRSWHCVGVPALSVGWLLDDYYHRAVLLEIPRFRELLGPPAEMFRFFRGDPVRMGRLMDLGLFPWWTDPSIKAEFLQALTVLTHRLDYMLWPDSPVLMHAQSLFWLGAAVAAAAAFYQRIMGPTWVAAVAALLFAVDERGEPRPGFWLTATF